MLHVSSVINFIMYKNVTYKNLRIKNVMFNKNVMVKLWDNNLCHIFCQPFYCIKFEIIYIVTRAGHALFLGLRAAPLLGRIFHAGAFALFFWPYISHFCICAPTLPDFCARTLVLLFSFCTPGFHSSSWFPFTLPHTQNKQTQHTQGWGLKRWKYHVIFKAMILLMKSIILVTFCKIMSDDFIVASNI